MKEIINYNIHNILKISLEREKKFDLMKGLDLEMSFFRVNDKIEDPDILIKVGKFKASNDDCYVVDNKYYIKENYFYCKDSADGLNWEIEILGFEKGKSVINYNYKYVGINNLISKFNYETLFLRPLIYSKMMEKKYFMIHGGSITFKNHSFLLLGCGGSYKTSIIMDLLRKSGFKYLGDDWVIIHKDESLKVYSFPAHFKLFNYLFENKKDENLTFIDKIKFIKSLWKSEKDFENVKVNDSSELKEIIFINKSNSNNLSFESMDLDDTINRLINNTKLEMNSNSVPMSGFSLDHFYRYITTYSYVFPDSDISKMWKNLEDELIEILNNFNFYELEVPDNYNSKIADKIANFIGR